MARAEVIFDRLVEHAWVCRRCWEAHDRLWQAALLCEHGQGLAHQYADCVLDEQRKRQLPAAS